jgi:hypothetical protein
MDAAMQKRVGGVMTSSGFQEGNAFKGVHTCCCGMRSLNQDYLLPGGFITNSLSLHYLMYHRDEVPESELAKVRKLPDPREETK